MLTDATLTFIALGAIFAYSFYAVLVAGQLSLGQAGFASLAAFTAVTLGPNPKEFGEVPGLLVAIAIGMVVGAIAAVVLGLPTMHLRGVFLAIATLAFAEAVRILILNMEWTGGAQGMSVPKVLTPAMAWIALALVAYWFTRQGRSRYGRALEAIREDELAARAMGIDVGRHRLSAFVTAGAVAGLYGVLWAYYVRLIAPEDFGFSTAIDGLVTAVVGGSTMFLGPLLGSAFFTLIPEIQRAMGVEAGWVRPFISSALLLLVILFLPGGLASFIPRRVRMPKTHGSDLGSDHVGLRTRQHPAPGDAVATLKALGKEYGGVHAVQGVDLDVRSGEVVGLIGPNGAGKTTLVNMISGLIPPSSGAATVLGQEIGKTPVHRVARAGVSRTFQHSKLFNRLSSLENVLVGGHLVSKPTFLRRLLFLPSARRDETEALEHAARCLERVGLGDLAASRASALSYGDQRRLEIARALASDPSLLILDEPAAGMNHVEAARLSELIRSLAADGLTILLIEHNVGMVLETCSRIVVLNFGKIIATGTPDEIAANPAVIEAYLGSEHAAGAEASRGVRAGQTTQTVQTRPEDGPHTGDQGEGRPS
jgi:branched-chain amino acid transport system permease protein